MDKAFRMEMEQTFILTAQKPSKRRRGKRAKLLQELESNKREAPKQCNGHRIRIQAGGKHVRITSKPLSVEKRPCQS